MSNTLPSCSLFTAANNILSIVLKAFYREKIMLGKWKVEK